MASPRHAAKKGPTLEPFHPRTTFSSLPLEIRLYIWDLSLQRNRLVITGRERFMTNILDAFCPHPVRPVLVNHESYTATRKTCLQLSQFQFPNADLTRRLPGYNPQHDTLYVPRTQRYWADVPVTKPGIELLRTLQALSTPPRSIATDLTRLSLCNELLAIYLQLAELCILVTLGPEPFSQVFHPNAATAPFDVAQERWGRNLELRVTRARKLTELMLSLVEAAAAERDRGGEGRMPVVKLQVWDENIRYLRMLPFEGRENGLVGIQVEPFLHLGKRERVLLALE